ALTLTLLFKMQWSRSKAVRVVLFTLAERQLFLTRSFLSLKLATIF
ncbi:cys/Met metabolism PLP-dependent enzyme family protein, partial [Vibrio parahaemolyticus V-223/04]